MQAEQLEDTTNFKLRQVVLLSLVPKNLSFKIHRFWMTFIICTKTVNFHFNFPLTLVRFF